MGTPQNPHHTHQELAQAGLPQYPPPFQGGGGPQSGAQGVSGLWGWVHFRDPPEAELPLGLGGPCQAGGVPRAGGGCPRLWARCGCPLLVPAPSLAASCPCQGCEALGKAGPRQAGLPVFPVPVLGDASLSRVLPTTVEWNVGLRTPHRWRGQGETLCPTSPVPYPMSPVPYPMSSRSARGCLSAAGEGLLSLSLSPSPASSRPHPAPRRTSA